jgi:hypothetical protein
VEFPPTTTDELYEVLKAFKEGDPNGNGIADEIPLLGATTGWNALPTNFLMNAFAYTRRGTYGGYLERASNGVRFVANTPEWREGLRYIHRLYAEELIGRETFTQKNDQAKATIENPDTEMVGSFPAGWLKTKGYVARDGSPAVTWPLETKTYGEVKRDDGWSRTTLRWGPVGTRALPPEFANDPSKQEWILMVTTRDMYQPLLKENYVPANLVFDEDVQDELADLTSTIAGGTGLVEQWSTEFIVGSRDIEDQSQWDTYVSELERAGVERYVEIWEDTLRNAGYIN